MHTVSLAPVHFLPDISTQPFTARFSNLLSLLFLSHCILLFKILLNPRNGSLGFQASRSLPTLAP